MNFTRSKSVRKLFHRPVRKCTIQVLENHLSLGKKSQSGLEATQGQKIWTEHSDWEHEACHDHDHNSHGSSFFLLYLLLLILLLCEDKKVVISLRQFSRLFARLKTRPFLCIFSETCKRAAENKIGKKGSNCRIPCRRASREGGILVG